VGYLHARGIVHRDIKPENVRLAADGTPKPLDFGIARDPRGPGLTREGQVLGTLQYMAPEQLAGAGASPRSDVWALGVLLYELLTGRPPFTAAAESEVISRIRTARFTAASSLLDGLPPGVDRLTRRCLEPKPDRRPGDAGAVATALDDLLAGEAAPALLAGTRGTWSDWRPAAALVSLVAVIALAAAALLTWEVAGPELPAPSSAGRAPAADRQLVTVEGLGHRYDVYRGGERLGETPLRFEAEFGSELELERRRDGAVVYLLAFTVGLRNSYPCRD
jgi:serine/threonine-protein kinase